MRAVAQVASVDAWAGQSMPGIRLAAGMGRGMVEHDPREEVVAVEVLDSRCCHASDVEVAQEEPNYAMTVAEGADLVEEAEDHLDDPMPQTMEAEVEVEEHMVELVEIVVEVAVGRAALRESLVALPPRRHQSHHSASSNYTFDTGMRWTYRLLHQCPTASDLEEYRASSDQSIH